MGFTIPANSNFLGVFDHGIGAQDCQVKNTEYFVYTSTPQTTELKTRTIIKSPGITKMYPNAFRSAL